MPMNRLLAAMGLALALGGPVMAQGQAKTRKVSVGPHYGASGLHEAMLGYSYRSLWTTPIEVEVLDLAVEAGGLAARAPRGRAADEGPRARGPGRPQLHLPRSSTRTRPTSCPRSSTTPSSKTCVQDQMAAQHPAGALVADELTKAAGVPTHADPPGGACPTTRRSASSAKDFAGLVGTLRPSTRRPPTREHPGFEGAIEIVDHMTLYARLAESPDERVAIREFLRARLLRSAHVRLRPPPQAVALGEAARGQRSGTRSRKTATRPSRATRACSCAWPPATSRSCGPSARGTTRSSASPTTAGSRTAGSSPEASTGGVAGDREGDADAGHRRGDRARGAADAARVVRARRSPPRRRHEAPPRRAARGGRPLLPAPGRARGRTGHERLRAADACGASRAGRSRSSWRAAPRAATAGTPYFSAAVRAGARPRKSGSTCAAGNDRVTVEGKGGPIRVRVVGGVGDDALDDSKGGGTRFYDFEGQSKRGRGSGHGVGRPAVHAAAGTEGGALDPAARLGTRLFPSPWASYSSDYGIFVGRGLRDPQLRLPEGAVRRASTRCGRAGPSGRSQPKIDYAGEFHRANSRLVTGVTAFYSGLEVLRYYGFGNETTAEGEDDFYKVRQRQIAFVPTLTLPAGGGARPHARAGPAVREDGGGRTPRGRAEAVRLRRASARWAGGRACGSTRAVGWRAPARAASGSRCGEGRAGTRRGASSSRPSPRCFRRPGTWRRPTVGWRATSPRT